MRWMRASAARGEDLRDASWVLVYATVEQPLAEVLGGLKEAAPTVPVFGTTSFQGVFTPDGFQRGAFALIGERGDAVTAASELVSSPSGDVRAQANAAARKLKDQLGAEPDVALLHATPGYEEAVIGGIDAAFGGRVRVFGGSAADDTIAGNWSVFSGTRIASDGFVLVGFRSQAPIHGDFMGGYLPSTLKGRVTRADGRRVFEIDGEPAAKVYDRWTRGAIAGAVRSGGTILAETTMHPLGRVVDEVLGIPVYLLSHPHQVDAATGALDLFTEVSRGDELILMQGTAGALVRRTGQVVRSALRRSDPSAVSGSILVYCGGCVGAILDRTDEVASEYSKAVAGQPFLGVATFGEQGAFQGSRQQNRHGNLMCDVVLFERPG